MRNTELIIASACVLAAATIAFACADSEQTPAPAAVAEDCLPYDPASLKIEDEGSAGWLLTDGESRMLTLDNKQDAETALALARKYKAHCFIGRNNRRADRCRYIVDYWK